MQIRGLAPPALGKKAAFLSMETIQKNSLPKRAMNDVYVVIAAYNESAAIGKVVNDLSAVCQNIVVVDDGSFDNTKNIARQAGATVLSHVINRGQGASLQTGITYAIGQGAQILVTFDADGQHSVGDLPRMIEPILERQVDIVLGSRFLENKDAVPLSRRILLTAGILFMKLTSKTRLTDAHNGFRAFSRQAAKQIDIQLDRMAHASELIDQIHQCGLPYKEVSVNIQYTDYSLKKGQHSGDAVRIAADYLFDKLTK